MRLRGFGRARKLRGRWVTGIGVGLAVYLVGRTLVPPGTTPGLAMLIAAVLIAVGIGAQV